MVAAVLTARAPAGDEADQFVRLLETELGPIMRTQPGFLESRLLRSGDTFVRMGFWRSRADQDRFMESFDRASIREAIRLVGVEFSEPVVYEVAAVTRAPAR